MQRVVFLPIISCIAFFLAFRGAHAQDPPSTPIGCVGIEENTDRYTLGSCNLHEQYARKFCCDDRNAVYYILGGHSLSSNKKTHHNTAWCVNSLPEEPLVDMSWCDVGCVGQDYSWDPDLWGYCGGGCDGCGEEWPCRAPTSGAAPCGYYRSVYSCDKSATQIPVPTTTTSTNPVTADPNDPTNTQGHENTEGGKPEGDKTEGGANRQGAASSTSLLLAVTIVTAAITFLTV